MHVEQSWEPLLDSDLAAVSAIAARIHPALPERPEVFAEKLRLFPAGCRKLLSNGECVGYGISHPWRLGSLPALDAFLEHLPDAADCLHLHDLAILPVARGHGAAAAYITIAGDCARHAGLHRMAMVSVYGTDVLWSRFGFRPHTNPQLTVELASYGSTAKYLICDLT